MIDEKKKTKRNHPLLVGGLKAQSTWKSGQNLTDCKLKRERERERVYLEVGD